MEVLLVAVGSSLAITFVHEYGHVLAGMRVGVPRSEMRVVFRGLAHVALRGNDGWVAPGRREYVPLFRRHVNNLRGAYAYVAGGLVAQTAAVVAFAVAMRAVDTPWVANVTAWVSLSIVTAYVILEAVLLRTRGYTFGDFSALWRMSRAWTAALTAAVFALHLVALLITA